jgi:DNA-binding CsgD family transcriptional regulator
VRLGEAHLRGVLGFLREAEAVEGSDPFPAHILDQLRTLVPSDQIGFCELDRVQRRVLAWVAAGDLGDDGPSEEEFWRMEPRHPLCTYQKRTGDFSAVKLSDFYGVRARSRTDVWEWFGRWKVADELEVGIPSPPWHTKTLLLDRSKSAFDESDRATLNLLQPHLAALYGQAAARRRLAAALRLLDHEDLTESRGVILIAASGRIEEATATAREHLATYFTDACGDRLPEAITTWISSQRTRLNGNSHAPHVRAPLTRELGGRRLVIRCSGNALLLEEQLIDTALSLLTPREREILALVAAGRSNAEIAESLSIAPGTVRRHLENIYGKLGVGSRTEALARTGLIARDRL